MLIFLFNNHSGDTSSNGPTFCYKNNSFVREKKASYVTNWPMSHIIC